MTSEDCNKANYQSERRQQYPNTLQYEAPHHAIFSKLLQIHPSSVKRKSTQYLTSRALCLFSSLNMSDKISHRYKTTSKIMVFSILIFNFF
jgi:hypothetical protein